MRLLTLPWCAVKQHFNLISLNNFLGYNALSFDCQRCLIIWFYIWEICFCSLLPFEFGNTRVMMLKIVFWTNGYSVVFGSTGCVLYNIPCMNQSSKWKIHWGAKSCFPMGVQSTARQTHFTAIWNTSFWEKPAETCCHMCIDWYEIKAGGGCWREQQAQPFNITVSRSKGRDDWGADSWNELPYFECGIRSVLVWIWWWSTDLHVLQILPGLKQCQFAIIVCICMIAGCTGQTGKRMRSMTA